MDVASDLPDDKDALKAALLEANAALLEKAAELVEARAKLSGA